MRREKSKRGANRKQIIAGFVVLAAVMAVYATTGPNYVSPREQAQLDEQAKDEPVAPVDVNKNVGPVTIDEALEQEQLAEIAAADDNAEVEVAQAEYPDVEPAAAYADSVSLIWPLSGETVMEYSVDKTVYDATLEQYRTNDSLWISANVGDKVAACEDGIVEFAGFDAQSGNTVTICHDNGWRTTYGQLDNITVSEGDSVIKGEVIGRIAAPTKSGVAQGPHLEFWVLIDEETVDPRVALG